MKPLFYAVMLGVNLTIAVDAMFHGWKVTAWVNVVAAVVDLCLLRVLGAV